MKPQDGVPNGLELLSIDSRAMIAHGFQPVIVNGLGLIDDLTVNSRRMRRAKIVPFGDEELCPTRKIMLAGLLNKTKLSVLTSRLFSIRWGDGTVYSKTQQAKVCRLQEHPCRVTHKVDRSQSPPGPSKSLSIFPSLNGCSAERRDGIDPKSLGQGERHRLPRSPSELDERNIETLGIMAAREGDFSVSAFPFPRTRPAAWSPRRTARLPRAEPGPSRLP